MPNLSERDLLLVWEQGLHQSLIERSLKLLEWAYPGTSPEEVARWSIGERDVRLLQLRAWLFGSILQNAAVCPACGQNTEWETNLDAFKLQPIGENAGDKLIDVKYEEHKIRFRLPNSADILDLTADDHPSAGTHELIKKCVVHSDHPALHNGDLPPELMQAILTKMEAEDPQADINIHLSCPDCNRQWRLNFDIMQYLWTEINDWAYRTLGDVGLLAYHFGWSENDILTMSRFRRNVYLNMIKE